jgi:hypothetical protein
MHHLQIADNIAEPSCTSVHAIGWHQHKTVPSHALLRLLFLSKMQQPTEAGVTSVTNAAHTAPTRASAAAGPRCHNGSSYPANHHPSQALVV